MKQKELMLISRLAMSCTLFQLPITDSGCLQVPSVDVITGPLLGTSAAAGFSSGPSSATNHILDLRDKRDPALVTPTSFVHSPVCGKTPN